ncbi:MAG: GAF domain-containing protein [Bacteroidales bacterium]|nr:GAF domain-containing protein [Bacteroidales bacterium]
MKIFPNRSRFSYGILMLLLIASIAGSFFSLYNHSISENPESIPFIAIVLSILTVALLITFYQGISGAWNAAATYASQIDELKMNLSELKKKEEKLKNEKDAAAEQKVEEDIEEVANNLVPQETYEDKEAFLEKFLSNIAKQHDIVQAVAHTKQNNNQYTITSSYAFFTETEPQPFVEGETLPGQVAKNKVILNLNSVPNDYITILSGLGKGSPSNLLIIPIVNPESNDCIAVIELASFKAFDSRKVKLFETLSPKISKKLLTVGNSTIE